MGVGLNFQVRVLVKELELVALNWLYCSHLS
jgi:hypothetical protein